MAQRVVRATVWSAAVGGVFAAACTIFALDNLVQDHNDQRLRAATVTLAGELDEERDEPSQDSLDSTLDDENDEIVTSGIRLAVYEGNSAIAGDAWAPLVQPTHCETFGVLGKRVRACARAYQRWVLVAAQNNDQQELRWFFLLAASGAILVGIGVAAVLGRRLSRWAVEPLAQLARKLEHSDPATANPKAFNDASDCSEVAAISAALEQLMSQVQALLEQARRLAADASHELRTPLASLSVQLELLSEQNRAEPVKPELQAALRRAQQLGVLVERLLLLAAPVDQLQGGFEAVALLDVVQEVHTELSVEQRQRISIDETVEGLVSGDLALLRSLVGNALSNALKYSSGEVLVRITQLPSQVQLVIADRGSGIAPQLRQLVFEPFYRAEAVSQTGHGLGLALVAHIVKAHGGQVAFADVSLGAELVIRLPSWRADEPRSGLKNVPL
jgi:signal transduction histidine kinase